MRWLPTPVFLSGEFHRQRRLVGKKSMGSQRVRHNLGTEEPILQKLEKVFVVL